MKFSTLKKQLADEDGTTLTVAPVEAGVHLTVRQADGTTFVAEADTKDSAAAKIATLLDKPRGR